MIYCTSCGVQIHDTAVSCPGCGAVRADANVSNHSRVVIALVCFFVGVLGVHRFMVGKIGTGVLQLLTLGGLGIWALIDFIVILTGGFKDKQGRKLS